MNRRLSEPRIRATCRELLRSEGRVSGRRLCQELRRRFGAVGKTERGVWVWRGGGGGEGGPGDGADLKRRLTVADAAAAENLARAERAEFREQAHQDKWAMEVDRLRQEI